jgi:hypothetical protein
MRIAIGDGFAVVAFGTNSPTGFQERLIGYSLKTGAEAARALVQGPLRQFELSADGARLLTVGSANGATEVFDAMTLERIGIYRHDEARPVTSRHLLRARICSGWLRAMRKKKPRTMRTCSPGTLVAGRSKSGAICPGCFQ